MRRARAAFCHIALQQRAWVAGAKSVPCRALFTFGILSASLILESTAPISARHILCLAPRPRRSARMCAPIARERRMRIYENVTRAIINEARSGFIGSPLGDDQTPCRRRHAGKLQWRHEPRASFFRMNVHEVLGRACAWPSEGALGGSCGQIRCSRSVRRDRDRVRFL